MRRWLLLLIALTGLSLCGAGPASADEGDGPKMPDEIRRIVERGELIVAIPSQELPVFFEQEEDGTYSGVDVELAQGIADSLGVRLVYDQSAATYDDMTELLNKGEVDLIVATYSLSPSRARYVAFSDPYLVINMGLMMNKQELLRHGTEKNPLPYVKQNPVKLTAVRGTSHVQLLKKLLPNATVVEAGDYQAAYDLVRRGEVAGMFCGELEFLSAYIRDPTLRLYTSVFTFEDVNDQFCVGVSLDRPHLLEYVNAYLHTANLVSKRQVEERYMEAVEKE